MARFQCHLICIKKPAFERTKLHPDRHFFARMAGNPVADALLQEGRTA
jgi:hypothetical protein